MSGVAESAPSLALLRFQELELLGTNAVHIGDNQFPWEDPSPQTELILEFDLPYVPPGGDARLSYEIFGVELGVNVLTLNGFKGNLSPDFERWRATGSGFPGVVLRAGANILKVMARDLEGGTSGNLDDFMIRNIKLRFLQIENPATLITSTRLTRVEPTATGVTLNWVVEQTPSLSLQNWQVVSGPLAWTGVFATTNGYFRLREAP